MAYERALTPIEQLSSRAHYIDADPVGGLGADIGEKAWQRILWTGVRGLLAFSSCCCENHDTGTPSGLVRLLRITAAAAVLHFYISYLQGDCDKRSFGTDRCGSTPFLPRLCL